MERNADKTFGAIGDQGSVTGSSDPMNPSGTGMAGSSAPPGGLDMPSNTANAGTTTPANTTTTSKTDRAKAVAQEKLGQAKEKARELQSSLADRLDAGAEKLRHRNETGTLAGATDGGAVSVTTDDRMTHVQDSVARGMNKSADWLRNGDLKADIEKQVRENPGRSLLIALGLGYVLGKALRSNR